VGGGLQTLTLAVDVGLARARADCVLSYCLLQVHRRLPILQPRLEYFLYLSIPCIFNFIDHTQHAREQSVDTLLINGYGATNVQPCASEMQVGDAPRKVGYTLQIAAVLGELDGTSSRRVPHLGTQLQYLA